MEKNLRIRKIVINNFQGIVEKIIDLDENYNEFNGDNGSGKTTILNAILWCLCGVCVDHTADIQHANKKKFNKVKTVVTISMDFNKEKYIIKRSVGYGKNEITVNDSVMQNKNSYDVYCMSKFGIDIANHSYLISPINFIEQPEEIISKYTKYVEKKLVKYMLENDKKYDPIKKQFEELGYFMFRKKIDNKERKIKKEIKDLKKVVEELKIKRTVILNEIGSTNKNTLKKEYIKIRTSLFDLESRFKDHDKVKSNILKTEEMIKSVEKSIKTYKIAKENINNKIDKIDIEIKKGNIDNQSELLNSRNSYVAELSRINNNLIDYSKKLNSLNEKSKELKSLAIKNPQDTQDAIKFRLAKERMQKFEELKRLNNILDNVLKQATDKQMDIKKIEKIIMLLDDFGIRLKLSVIKDLSHHFNLAEIRFDEKKNNFSVFYKLLPFKTISRSEKIKVVLDLVQSIKKQEKLSTAILIDDIDMLNSIEENLCVNQQFICTFTSNEDELVHNKERGF